MMAIGRNPNEYALVHALEPSGQRRWLTPQNLTALAAAVALHLALVAYLYTQHFSTPLTTEPPTRAIEVITQRWAPPPKPMATELHNPVKARAMRTVDRTETFHSPPFTPQRQTKVDDIPVTTNTAQSEAPTPPPVITDPIWLSRPSGADMAAYYPSRALEDGVDGKVSLTCAVAASGLLNSCRVNSETPPRAGFGQAALKLVPLFRLSPRTENGRPIDGALIAIPFVFTTSD